MSGKGVISENGLMQRLVQAKKVMNKVDGGNYERGHVNETVLRSNPEELNVSEVNTPTQKPANYTPNKVMESKLPDAIKRAMIENPIPQISLSDSLDMDFVKNTKKLMEAEGVATKPKQTSSSRSIPQSSNIDMNEIAIIIENTVRKVLDEKLNQILTAQQTLSINEIKIYVDRFIEFAKNNKEKIFLVTEIGCGLAGLKPKDVAPLFKDVKNIYNVYLPERFWENL
jgi:hypothetical protein